MNSWVLSFHDIDRTHASSVGGKGVGLGELARIEGVHVPDGFCVTTEAFRHIMSLASVDHSLDSLARLKADDRESIRALSAELRSAIERVPMPSGLADAIIAHLAGLGARHPCAVRSSATAEDLQTASFAGQQDTYLNVVGASSILEHISRCWASLFTERAVTYRIRNGFDHRKVSMAVVVQQMVNPRASGVLFTADPMTGNRKISSIDASYGLGEALVSGLVNPDMYKVRDDKIISKSVGTKQVVIRPLASGGTHEISATPEQRGTFALTDAEAVRLAAVGRKIEAYLGRPQDIEWCLANDLFQVVQSRPITTLFPAPVTGDQRNHVYVSVGHQQMMTDAMRPLGLSVWQLTTPRPMAEAGGRLFVDITDALATSESRATMLGLLEKSDPLIRDALQSVIDRGDFIRSVPNNNSGQAQTTPPARQNATSPTTSPAGSAASAPSSGLPPIPTTEAPIETDPAIVIDLIRRNAETVSIMQREIEGKSGIELVDFIVESIGDVKRTLADPRSMQVIMAGMEATWWLNDKLLEWLGEKNAADVLAQSVPNNVTSEMGLALLDVADVLRPSAEVVSFLEQGAGENFLDELPKLSGGQESRIAIEAWLDKYGMRGAGEIDITRTRWRERPATLIPLVLSNIKYFKTGEAARRFALGRVQSDMKEQDLLQRLRLLPDGEARADETKRMIHRLRTFVGYREYPKYGMINRYFVYKTALMQEANRLVNAGVLQEAEDIFYLRIQELQQVARTRRVDHDLIRKRKDEYQSFVSLRPPRVLTSDGEGLSGSFRRENLPAGALVGLAVSTGIIEGRARVILDMSTANLEPGDILVTVYTDPSWTPLFVAITGLVTEVGGLMTHGAVIAREYGLPAVVGVELATRRIRDGQHIRVDGGEGIVELLE